MSGIQPMNAAARSLATSPASQLAAGIENAFEALQVSFYMHGASMWPL